MKSRRNAYLPRLRISAPFLSQMQQSLDRFAPLLTSKGLPPPSSPIPWDVAQNCSLLALAADVDALNAHLNMVLGDLEKLGADPVAFKDTDPEPRYKSLLRSAQMAGCQSFSINSCVFSGQPANSHNLNFTTFTLPLETAAAARDRRLLYKILI
jgi:hypothetical protein